jgi:hypothetical protein
MSKNKGFRDGKKEKMFDNLSDEEKQTIKDMREYNERKLENEYATKLFVLRDQAKVLLDKTCNDIEETIIALLGDNLSMLRFQKMINESKNDDEITTEKFSDGTQMSVADLKVHVMKIDHLNKKKVALIRSYASDLYRFVGTKRIDGKILYTEEDFNGKIEDIISRLKQTSYKLF